MGKSKYFSAKRLTGIAILLALVIVLQAALGVISIGVVTLNFTLIPIVLGAVLYGAIAGAFLGFACGVVILIQVMMGGSLFYVTIWAYTPFLAAITCIIKTTVAGLVAGWLFKLIAKKNVYVGLFVASGIVPIINTGLFILGCFCMNESITVFQTALVGLGQAVGDMNMFVFILVMLVTFNFFIEFALNLLLTPAIHRVISVVDKNFKRKKAQ